MKKHLSLFLALLLLFSALLAFPAEAVQPEPMQEDTMTVSTRQEIQAPRATDLYGTGDSINQYEGGPGPEPCTHRYVLYSRYNTATTHTYICSKCSNRLVRQHSWVLCGYGKYCAKCGYSVGKR